MFFLSPNNSHAISNHNLYLHETRSKQELAVQRLVPTEPRERREEEEDEKGPSGKNKLACCCEQVCERIARRKQIQNKSFASCHFTFSTSTSRYYNILISRAVFWLFVASADRWPIRYRIYAFYCEPPPGLLPSPSCYSPRDIFSAEKCIAGDIERK